MELTYENLRLQNYRNNSIAISLDGKEDKKDIKIKLTTSDAMLIPILAGLNCLYISDTGGGKTRALKDIYTGIFGGNVEQEGTGIWTMGRKDFTIDSIFTQWSKTKEKYVLVKPRLNALCIITDELNRAPNVIQTDFFDFAEGNRSIDGIDYELGKENYSDIFPTGSTVNSYVDASVNTAEPYYYCVTAEDLWGNTGTASAAMPAFPYPPAGLTAVPYNSKVYLAWETGYDPEITLYNVFRSTDAGLSYVSRGSTRYGLYVDSAVNGIGHIYRVSAFGSTTGAYTCAA